MSSMKQKNEMTVLAPVDSTSVTQYKDFIREQDMQIEKLNETVDTLMKEKQELKSHIYELRTTISYLNDQNLVLRAAQTNLCDGKEPILCANNSCSSKQELDRYKDLVTELEDRLAKHVLLIEEYKQKDNSKKESALEERLKQKTEELEKLEKDQEDLLQFVAYQDSKITFYKERLIALGEKVESDDNSADLDTDDLLE